MLTVTISCARSETSACPQLLVHAAGDAGTLPDAVTQRLETSGWITKNAQHHCPRHDPAQVGEPLEVGAQYTPIADTGWEIRVPPMLGPDAGHKWLLEIRRRPAMEDAE